MVIRFQIVAAGLLLIWACVAPTQAAAQTSASYVSSAPVEAGFSLVDGDGAAPILLSEGEHGGVFRAARDLQADIRRVTSVEPKLFADAYVTARRAIIVGTIGRSRLIDRLIESGRINVSDVAGRWETYLIETVDAPELGLDQALVIAGSDKRGTIYGIYDLSYEMGVSPWHYWADVPPRQRSEVHVLPGRHTRGEPAVKYRGIFINDENPALLGWANETFGGFTHRFYETVFELILRMRGNYLWPAMWGKAFSDDDPLNAQMADRYGVVIGTSHHEPMMRAHVEWERYGSGDWNYETNDSTLREFWREGIKRMGDYESIVTVGMRGDGDEPMTQGTAIALLERIVADQREILQEVTGEDPSSIPQIWALYKEVQEYYEQGMRVPDDVTLLLADDNWGNLRLLPDPDAPSREGGYGIYYHYDYVGGPRNYKWLNTNQIERVWEQMHLAYRHGADRIWIVNVGDIKPMEFPTEFFLDYAWNPDELPLERLPEYSRLWAERQFGREHAAEIGALLDTYTKYNARRKPELLSPETYSLIHYREADRIVEESADLTAQAEDLYEQLPIDQRDAFHQLVLFPIQASANLNELYVVAAKNRLYAEQGRAATNAYADSVRALFEQDAELTRIYHDEMAGGKWNHMMSQTHIGYTYWQQPEENVMPEVVEVDVPQEAAMGVAVEGSELWWPMAEERAVLPEFDPYLDQRYYIEVFNRGRQPFEYRLETDTPWLRMSADRGQVDDQERVWVEVDWEEAPHGRHQTMLRVQSSSGEAVEVDVPIHNPHSPRPEDVDGFVESNGYMSIEAVNYTRAVDGPDVEWRRIPNLGRTGSAMTVFPVTADPVAPGDESPRLEYRLRTFSEGAATVRVYLSPTLDFRGTGGLRYAVSIDDAEPQIINMHENQSEADWERWVADNIIVRESVHQIEGPGEHVLKFWAIDPAVVLQKLVVDFGGMQPSYLGPPESARR